MAATSSIGPGALNMVTCGRRRARQPPPGPPPRRRHVPEPHPRPGAPAGRALRLALTDGERRLSGLSRGTGIGSRGPSRSSSRSRWRSRRCSTRPTAARRSSGCPRTSRRRRTTTPRRCSARVHELLRRQRPDRRSLGAAVAALRRSQRLLLVAGGVHYSLAEDELACFAEAHGIPVVETVAGKSSLLADHPCLVGPLGVTGADHANRLAAEADLVLAVGTRLQDFTTGSLDRVRRGRDIDRPERRPLRRDEAPRPAAGLRRAGRAAELERERTGWGADEAWTGRAWTRRPLSRRSSQRRRPPGDMHELTYAQVMAPSTGPRASTTTP